MDSLKQRDDHGRLERIVRLQGSQHENDETDGREIDIEDWLLAEFGR